MKKVTSKMIGLSLLIMLYSGMHAASADAEKSRFQASYQKAYAVLTSSYTWKMVGVVAVVYAIRTFLPRENRSMPTSIPQSTIHPESPESVDQDPMQCAQEGHSFYSCPACLNRLAQAISAKKKLKSSL